MDKILSDARALSRDAMRVAAKKHAEQNGALCIYPRPPGTGTYFAAHHYAWRKTKRTERIP